MIRATCCLFATVLVLSGVLTGQESQGLSRTPVDLVNFDTLTVELATAQKAIGDEKFIFGDRKGAREAYELASRYVSEINPQNLPPQADSAAESIVNLLRADIAYRTLLLDTGYSFWGGIKSTRIYIPEIELRNLKASLSAFEKIKKEIDDRVSKLQEVTNSELSTFAAQQVDAEGKAAAQAQQAIAADLKGSFYQRRRDSILGRIDGLAKQRAQLEQEAAAAEKEAADVKASTSSLIIQAAAASAGVPPDLAKGVATGNVKQAISGAISSGALTNIPEVASAVRDLKNAAPQLTAAVQQYEELRQKGDAIAGGLKSAETLLRNPSLENLIRVGTAACGSASLKATCTTVRADLERSKPVMSLVSVVNIAQQQGQQVQEVVKDVKRGVASLLAGDPKLIEPLTAAAKQFVAKNGLSGVETITSQYRTFIDNVASLNIDDDEARLLIDKMVRIWSTAFVAHLRATAPTVLDDIISDLGATSDVDVAGRLAAQGLSVVSRLRVQAGQLQLTTVLGDKSVGRVTDLLHLAKRVPDLETTRDALQRQYTDLITELASKGTQYRRLILESIDVADTENILRQWLDEKDNAAAANRRADAWKAIVSNAPTNTGDWLRREVTNLGVGTLTGQAFASTPSLEPAAPAAPSKASGGDTGKAVAEATAMAALNAAFPGASVVVSLVNNFTRMQLLIQRMNDLAVMMRDLLLEEARLRDVVADAILDDALAQREAEIALLLQDAAEKQVDIYRSAIVSLGTQAKATRDQIALRRPLTFFMAERMRRQFDQLEASFATWLSPESTVAKLVHENPQNLRFAIDSDIHLFGWLNREREATRVDLDVLLNHWRQIVALVEEVKDDIGSVSPGDGRFGDIGTIDLSLKRLVPPAQWNRFVQWQKAPGVGGLQLTFTIDPSDNWMGEVPDVPGGRTAENVRVIEVRLAGVNRERETALNSVSLEHPGHALVRAPADSENEGVFYQRELRPLVRQAAFDSGPFDVAKLRAWWSQPAAGVPRAFEGYSPYTTWTISFSAMPPDSGIDALGDIRVRISYFYIDKKRLSTEAQFVQWLQHARSSPSTNLSKDEAWVRYEFPVRWFRLQLRSQAKGVAKHPRPIELQPSQFSSVMTQLDGTTGKARLQKVAGAPDCSKAAAGCPALPEFKLEAVCRTRDEIRADLFDFYKADGRDKDSRGAILQSANRSAQTAMTRFDNSGVCRCQQAPCRVVMPVQSGGVQ